jgi:hypothetical protein
MRKVFKGHLCCSFGPSVPSTHHPPPPEANMTTSSAPITSAQAKGFLGALFDFSFTNFITTKIIKLLYVISMLGAAAVALSIIVAGFNVNSGVGLLALILSPVAFLLVVAYSRIALELVIVFFRIEEHTAASLRLDTYRATSL